MRLDLIDPQRSIWEYDVIFKPEVDNKFAKIFLVNRHFRALQGVVKSYDGGSRLFTPLKTEDEVRKFIPNTFVYGKFHNPY